MCIASLHASWPLEETLALWATVHYGTFSKNGKTFDPAPTSHSRVSPTGHSVRYAPSRAWRGPNMRELTHRLIRSSPPPDPSADPPAKVRHMASLTFLHRTAPGRGRPAHHPEEPGHGPGLGTGRSAPSTKLPAPLTLAHCCPGEIGHARNHYAISVQKPFATTHPGRTTRSPRQPWDPS